MNDLPKKRTVEQINKISASIADVQIIFGTTEHLPDFVGYIPGFRQYELLAEGIFFGKIPSGTAVMRDGINQANFANRLIPSHLKSCGPKHEDKIRKVAFLLWEAIDTIDLKES